MLVNAVGWYESVVDAQSGQILYRRNYTSDAEGNVYTSISAGVGSQQITSFDGQSFDNNGWVSGRVTSGRQCQRLPGFGRQRERRLPAADTGLP